MGFVREGQTRVFAPAATAAAWIAQGMQVAGVVGIDSTAHVVSGRTNFSLGRNRHKAEVSFAADPESAESTILNWSVDMLGDKHFEIVDEILAASRLAVDDLGVTDALNRLGKMGRFFGALEARSLSRYVRLNERVVELAQGVYAGHQGMLVLTNRRLFFLDKGFKSDQLEEFDLRAIGSIGTKKRIGGESIEIAISGRTAEIKQIAHGRADALLSAYRRIKDELTAPAPAHAAVAPQPDAIDQLRRLSELRDAGILTEAEFATKKADILGRI
jgi:hypothetical protein